MSLNPTAQAASTLQSFRANTPPQSGSLSDASTGSVSDSLPGSFAESLSDSLYGCVHLPDYPVQALTRYAPELRRKPIAILDGAFPLFTVIATNAFARGLGVAIGMSRLQLEQFPGLLIRPRSREQEDAAHRALLDCAHQFTPRIEDTAPDTIALDLNGLTNLWGAPRPMAQRLFQAAAKLGLEAHVAVAPNPDASIHAARFDAGISVLSTDDMARKLAALPLNILPASPDVAETFRRWGLETFEDLTRLSAVEISERLGQDGVGLQQMAKGETCRPLQVLYEKPYFKESMKLEHSIDSIESLTFIMSRLLHQITERLTARNQTTNQLRLSLKLERRSTAAAAARHRISAAADGSNTPTAFVRTLRFPLPIRDSKILLKLLQMDLDMNRPPAPVTQVVIDAEPVEPRRVQNGLFTPLAPEPEKLELTLARIGAIVGSENVGSPRILDTHRPDTFRIERFSVSAGPNRPKTSTTRPGPSRQGATCVPSGAGSTRPAPPMALRILRPAQPATVETRHGQPARILFGGKDHTVLNARGPWSSSGEWWRQEPWNREEWDVEVRNGWRRALYRIYHDPRRDTWFVDGSYD